MRNFKQILTLVLLIVMAATLYTRDLPLHWFTAGSHPKSYDMGLDSAVQKDGKVAALCANNNLDNYSDVN